MGGNWTTVSSYTEKVEDPNPAVWYEAAKNADTYEEAMQLYDKAEKYYATDSMGYSPEWFFKERLYFKFHKSRARAIGCIILIFLGSFLYHGYNITKRQEMAKLEAERERYAVYQKEREQQQIREREIQKKIREQREKARIQAEKEAAEKEARENANKPEQRFLAFHQAISDRRLRDAYNILSPDYQRFVGSYEKFAPGYDTTISSEVVELRELSQDSNTASYSYKLKAVDRTGNGQMTRYFVGKTKLIKINGQWRIDSTEAKKASESSSLPTKTENSSVSNSAFKKTVGTITGNDVNVRKGPGIDYKSLGVFFKGDKVRIIDSNRNSVNETWYKIEFDNPTFGLIVGWVRSDFIYIK